MGIKPRKIGIVSEYFYPHLGGITEHVYFFSKKLIELGYDVTLLTGYQGEPTNRKLPSSLKIINLGKSVPIYSNHSFAKVTLGWNLGSKIREVLARENFDLLHIHSPFFPILPILFQKYSQTVTVATLHTYFDFSVNASLFYRLFRWKMQQYVDKLDGIISVSSSAEETISRFFNTKCTVIPNGVDVDWFGNPTGRIKRYDDGSPNILFLGRFDPRNGLDTLLSAFPLVLKEIPSARLIVVGDGPMRPFYEDQARPYLGKNIFFEGQINENRPEYFATSNVFCYPATKASFGVTIVEAMAAGIPIVAADNIGFRGVMTHGVHGLLIKPQDPGDLALALIKILKNRPMALEFSRNCRKEAKKYSWDRITNQVIQFYNEVYLKKKGVPFAA